MLPYFTLMYGNPSSVHRWGQEAEAAVSAARELTASLLDCDESALSFTSGALYAIAARLHVSHATVRNHVQHILNKFGVHSIMEAVALYLLHVD